jgi:anti-sigma factor ChrR (cupin superfamily)
VKISRIENFTRGWFIGNFDPSLFKTEAFEVSLMKHKKGEKWPAHYHKIATEYNVLLKGTMSVLGHEFSVGDVFVIEPMEIANPEFFEDVELICVKVPSVIGDKYEVL